MKQDTYKKYIYVTITVGIGLIFIIRLGQLQLLESDYKMFAQAQAIFVIPPRRLSLQERPSSLKRPLQSCLH